MKTTQVYGLRVQAARAAEIKSCDVKMLPWPSALWRLEGRIPPSLLQVLLLLTTLGCGSGIAISATISAWPPSRVPPLCQCFSFPLLQGHLSLDSGPIWNHHDLILIWTHLQRHSLQIGPHCEVPGGHACGGGDTTWPSSVVGWMIRHLPSVFTGLAAPHRRQSEV